MTDRADDTSTIVTVTAKIWYVSSFTGGKWGVPQKVLDSYEGGDTTQNRAQAIAKDNIKYMNFALANSNVPMRYVQWGSVQDLGKTESDLIKPSC